MSTIDEEAEIQDMGVTSQDSGELQDGNLKTGKENGVDVQSSGQKGVDEVIRDGLGGTSSKDDGNENVRSNGLFKTENGMGLDSNGGHAMKSNMNSNVKGVCSDSDKSKEAGLCLTKPKPTRVPLWVKIFNIPLEAWNIEGISRIASRVLIKVDVTEGLVDNIEVCYKSIGRSMSLKVKYAWVPPVCLHFKVFEHSWQACKNREITIEEMLLKFVDKEEMVYSNGYKNALMDEERLNKSRIESIIDDDGHSFTGVDVADKFVEHFQNILALRGILILWMTLSSYNKAPRPDGFTSKFFKAAWGIMGGDVYRAVKEFFDSGKMLGELNSTIISFVPKSKNPNTADYRPIACCGVVYSCVSKVITNRIKKVLNELIDPNQGAFIK
nr:RNA-directed DNA polymerase, eukaryota, reverse transcriptase zinc-binding domain protein [Tanacetum cinerariifolium]